MFDFDLATATRAMRSGIETPNRARCNGGRRLQTLLGSDGEVLQQGAAVGACWPRLNGALTGLLPA
jgi:hypothetical protein